MNIFFKGLIQDAKSGNTCDFENHALALSISLLCVLFAAVSLIVKVIVFSSL